MQYRCLCICHDTEIDMHVHGVMTDDALEAVVACDSCKNNHVRALLVTRESLGLPPKRGPRVVKHDPRSFEQKYAEYKRAQERESEDGC
jgi:hypothetical protein